MARPLRLEFAGALYHVTARGDRREPIHEDDADRSAFLDIFGTVVEDFNWVAHAYCLMGNHYHLLVETPDANLANGMRQLNGTYTQWSNRTHHRVGHLFQGRYKAIVVDKDAYLLEVYRYIVLNPVRAKMVKSVADWPWSSHRAVMGTQEVGSRGPCGIGTARARHRRIFGRRCADLQCGSDGFAGARYRASEGGGRRFVRAS